MKKIMIFYASYGGGHLNAAKSIHEYLKKHYPDTEIGQIDCMKYVNLPLEKMTTAAYREMAKRAPWAWGTIYSHSQKGPLAHLSSRSNKIMAIKLLQLLREKQPDLIISTHPFGSQMCNYLKRKGKIQAKIATIMTDFAPHDQWLVGADFTDYFFVAHDKMRQYLEQKGIAKNKVFATGIPISNRFLEMYPCEEIIKQFELSSDKFTILFFGGGEFGLGKTKTLEIFEEIVSQFHQIQMIAIAGKNDKLKQQFQQIVEQNHKTKTVKVLSFTDKVPELMSISDIVITKPGGLTTSESLACQLPMIVINPIPGQEKENAEFLENKGIAIWLKKHNSITPILSDLLAHPEKLEEMKQHANQLGKRYATKTICDILMGNET